MVFYMGQSGETCHYSREDIGRKDGMSEVEITKMLCPQCDNDCEFEPLQGDDDYNYICGVCGWKLEDKGERLRSDIAKWLDPWPIADLIISQAKEDLAAGIIDEINFEECKELWLSELENLGTHLKK